jgi:hypothetical protein
MDNYNRFMMTLIQWEYDMMLQQELYEGVMEEMDE